MEYIHLRLPCLIFSVLVSVVYTTQQLPVRSGMKSQGCVDCMPKLGIDNVFYSLSNTLEDGLSMIDQIKSLINIMALFFLECVKPKLFFAQARLYAPCKLIIYETYNARVDKLWRIKVPYQHAINMTILKGYVPFKDICRSITSKSDPLQTKML